MPAAVPDLIEQAKSGDPHAFRKVVEAHQGFAYAVAFRFVGDRNEAEDITQEAFINLWKNIGKYRPEIKLTTWLYKILMNLCLDFLKSSQRKQQLKTEDVESDQVIIDQSSQEQKLDDAEMFGCDCRVGQTTHTQTTKCLYPARSGGIACGRSERYYTYGSRADQKQFVLCQIKNKRRINKTLSGN